ncbi:type III-B CRISPR module RAMP protein Cmr1 [Candidatus Electronema sp. JC]|uniref:type III-B CRISPR module RAMP protein Cmr1 n=1 Tax=Candidatus Electronema sp. JC TaxID=3401570 RepID=UPI003B429729
MIDTIAFQIECVSPTLNLGAEKQPEYEIFRAASLRGCWRFWARAAIAGILEKPDPNTLRLLENSLFGSVEPAFQAFRMRVDRCNSPTKDSFLILPHKHQGKQAGFSPGSTAEVRISLHRTIHNQWDEPARKALLAAIWLWGNLGGIGTRSRRGFGSVALLPDADGKDAFAAAGLPKCCETFASRNSLVECLQAGIDNSFQIIREWISAKYKTKKSLDQKRGATEDMFILSSLAQVFIGEMFQSCNDLLRIIADKKAVADETGSAVPHRLASPMIVRLHRCAEGFIPVLTWSPREKLKIAKDIGNYQWLNDLGVKESLLGNGDSIYA